MVKDLVCGMDVDETDEHTPFKQLGREKYFFCSVECMLIFMHEPLSFTSQEKHVKNTTLDIVCRMKIGKEHCDFRFKYHGRWYYFCSHSCLQEFARKPQTYASTCSSIASLHGLHKTLAQSDNM